MASTDLCILNNSNLTIKQIIENTQQGIPSSTETRKQLEKLNKFKNKQLKLTQTSSNHSIQNKADTLVKKDDNLNFKQINVNEQSNPQIGPKIILVNGKPQVDQNSLILVIQQKDQNQGRELEIVQNKKYFVTSASFKDRSYTSKWSPEETRKFYKALEIFGTDFSMIAKLFKKRNRIQIKNKFRKEEKQNAQKIDAVFKHYKKYNSIFSLTDRLKKYHYKKAKQISQVHKMVKYDSQIKQDSISILPNQEQQIHTIQEIQNYSNSNDNKELMLKKRNRLDSIASLDSLDNNMMEEICDLFKNEILINQTGIGIDCLFGNCFNNENNYNSNMMDWYKSEENDIEITTIKQKL